MIIEKCCRICNLVKPITEFRKRLGASDGYRTECKACKSDIDRRYRQENREDCAKRDAEYYAKNKESVRLRGKQYYEENKESISIKTKEYYERNKEHLRNKQREWLHSNKDSVKQKQRENYVRNREKALARGKERYASNKEHILQYLKEYQEKNAASLRVKKAMYRYANKGRISMLRKRYEERLARATPDWLSECAEEEMEDFYTAAQMFRTYTGVEYQVDHIVPLQGKIVCGLNVPWNMQLLTESDNKKKNNRHWPDMPE